MTFFAYRDDIKPMNTLITPMVILLSLFVTVSAFQQCRAWQFSRAHGTSNRPTGAALVAVTRKHLLAFLCFRISGISFFGEGYTLFATEILGIFLFAVFCREIFSTTFPRIGFTLFRLPVLCIAIMLAGFAPASKTIFAASILTKLRQWFRGLAFRAGLCYDVLSHFNLPKRLFWLEPVLAGYIPAPGSFYYSRAWRQVK